MTEKVLFGRGNKLVEIPQHNWERHLEEAPAHSRHRLAFMGEDHHRVRNFVVSHLPTAGSAIPPSLISSKLNLAIDNVASILAELEANLTFLYRDESGSVAWAYPVTAEKTPHAVTFSSGEQIFAA
jgi:hypothetical protein